MLLVVCLPHHASAGEVREGSSCHLHLPGRSEVAYNDLCLGVLPAMGEHENARFVDPLWCPRLLDMAHGSIVYCVLLMRLFLTLQLSRVRRKARSAGL
jgi:hypothetical protein